MFVATQIAHYKTPKNIIYQLQKNYGVTITGMQVNKYANSKKWVPVINKLREAWLMDIGQVAGSHKRVRMERLEKLYAKAYDDDQIETARRILETERDEMEGRGSENNTVNLNFTQLNLLSDEELDLHRRKVMEKIKLLDQKIGDPNVTPKARQFRMAINDLGTEGGFIESEGAVVGEAGGGSDGAEEGGQTEE